MKSVNYITVVQFINNTVETVQLRSIELAANGALKNKKNKIAPAVRFKYIPDLGTILSYVQELTVVAEINMIKHTIEKRRRNIKFHPELYLLKDRFFVN